MEDATSSHRIDPQNYEPATDERKFGSLVRTYRLSSGFTQEELAERAGISARAVSDLERGLYLAPHRDTVLRLAAALGLTPDATQELETLVNRQRGPTQASGSTLAALPTGTVTFLAAAWHVSDRSEEVALAELQEAVERLAELVEQSVERHNGSVVPTRGAIEGRLAVFRKPSDGVSAALEVQQNGTDPLVKVRLALHTGEADLRDGSYFGSAVGRSLRLSSLAVGGQTLVSQTTSQLLAAALPPNTLLRELDGHPFAGLAERVFLLVDVNAESLPVPQPLSALARHCETMLRASIDQRLVFFLGPSLQFRAQDAQGHIAPTDDELASRLASSFQYPSEAPHELVRVAQYVATMVGEGRLYEELHAMLDGDYKPNPVHQFLAALPGALAQRGYKQSFPLIVTTCLDDSLERAFQTAREPFDLVTYIAEGDQRGYFLHRAFDGRPRLIDRPNKYDRLSDRQTVILKIHGAVDRLNPEYDSFVVTEDDFLDYLPNGDLANLIPVTVAARLKKSHFLFLGYDVRDWNLRVILRRLWGEQRLRYKSWAIYSTPPEPLVRELWRRRDVEVLDVPVGEYVTELQARLDALAQVSDG